MPLSVFAGVSVDGFLAHRDGSVGFLGTPKAGPHGFEEFCASVDAVVMGAEPGPAARCAS